MLIKFVVGFNSFTQSVKLLLPLGVSNSVCLGQCSVYTNRGRFKPESQRFPEYLAVCQTGFLLLFSTNLVCRVVLFLYFHYILRNLLYIYKPGDYSLFETAKKDI